MRISSNFYHKTAAMRLWIVTTASLHASDTYTIIGLPDTQDYVSSYPEIFDSQTQWVADNVATENIVFVAHQGDVVNDDKTVQWNRAKGAMNTLDGVVPYALARGNHDNQYSFQVKWKDGF